MPDPIPPSALCCCRGGALWGVPVVTGGPRAERGRICRKHLRLPALRSGVKPKVCLKWAQTHCSLLFVLTGALRVTVPCQIASLISCPCPKIESFPLLCTRVCGTPQAHSSSFQSHSSVSSPGSELGSCTYLLLFYFVLFLMVLSFSQRAVTAGLQRAGLQGYGCCSMLCI